LINKKVLITGANGLLGSAFMSIEGFGFKIPLSSSVVDITDFEAVKSFLIQEKPDIIVHCAAFTDVEKCEIEKDRTYLVNTIGTANLVYALMQLENEPIFCFISSTGVYGAHKCEPYTEFDAVTPTTTHHSSKFEAEKIVSAHIRKHLIIRTGWLFGGSVAQPKNFVYKRFLEASSKAIMYSNGSQIGNPTFTEDVVKQVVVLLNRQCYGVYNCVNGCGATRYEYVKTIVELFGIECKVDLADKDLFKRAAPVSDNEAAVNYKLKLMGLDIMPEWKISLAEYIKRLKRELNV